MRARRQFIFVALAMATSAAGTSWAQNETGSPQSAPRPSASQAGLAWTAVRTAADPERMVSLELVLAETFEALPHAAPPQALCRASRRTPMAWATAARVAWVLLSGLSIMKSCVMPS